MVVVVLLLQLVVLLLRRCATSRFGMLFGCGERDRLMLRSGDGDGGDDDGDSNGDGNGGNGGSLRATGDEAVDRHISSPSRNARGVELLQSRVMMSHHITSHHRFARALARGAMMTHLITSPRCTSACNALR